MVPILNICNIVPFDVIGNDDGACIVDGEVFMRMLSFRFRS